MDKDILKLMRKDAAGKTPDVFDKITSSAQNSGLINAGQAETLGAAHASSAAAGKAAAVVSTKAFKAAVTALAVTAAVSTAIAVPLAVNNSNPGSSTPPAIEAPDPSLTDPKPTTPTLIVETDGLEYVEIAGGYAVKGIGKVTDKDIVIPKMHEGKPVKEIAKYARFRNLDSFYIQENIERIDTTAFSGTTIKKFIVADGNARYCVKNNCIVDKVEKTLVRAGVAGTIPTDGSVKIIGEEAFSDYNAYGNGGDVKLIIPEGIEELKYHAFYYTTFAYEVDDDLNYTSELTLPSTLKTIGEEAFFGARLGTLIIPSTVESMGKNAFSTCTMQKVILNGVKEIGEGAFYRCPNLNEVSFSGVEKIGDSAFSECNSLESIEIGQGVKIIGNSAFDYSKSLKTVNLPISLEEIGYHVFLECDALESVNYEASKYVWKNVKKGIGWDALGDNKYLGDKFKCTGLGAPDVWNTGVHLNEYAFNSAQIAGVVNTIELDKNGHAVMVNTKDGNGYRYEGTWTCEVVGGKLCVTVNYDKYAVTDGVTDYTSVGSGTIKFQLWYEHHPNYIGTNEHKWLKYVSGDTEFCSFGTDKAFYGH
ncbi:MAG: leucine-rich repeat domain-containing protein [Clostridia bacterium]|nr:leucine-rich repeat domain-containing protein [Clostridia bacterium]